MFPVGNFRDSHNPGHRALVEVDVRVHDDRRPSMPTVTSRPSTSQERSDDTPLPCAAGGRGVRTGLSAVRRPRRSPTATPTCSRPSRCCAPSPRCFPAPSSPTTSGSRLMTAAETELVAAPNVVRLAPRRTSKTRRRLGTAAASLVIVGGTAGMAAAASGALPGEPLYPVKRGVEQAGDRRADERRQPGRGPARPGRHPPRRGPRAPGPGLSRPRAARDHPRLLPHCRRRGLRRSCSRPTRPRATRRTSPPCATSPPRRWPTSPRSPTGRSNPATDETCSTRPTPWPTSTSRPASCAAPAARQAALAPPEALSAGAGAAAADNLLARPVTQAQADVAAVEAARNAALKAGASAAEADRQHDSAARGHHRRGGLERPVPPRSDRP